METKKHVVVIGAGPAGLAAAYRLLQEDAQGVYRVTVLEASDAVGGISKTVAADGNRMDLGGHRFFSKVWEVNDWWAQLLPQTDPESEDAVLMTRERLSRIYFNKTFIPYPISLSFRMLADLGFGTSAQVVLSYLKSLVFKREENSLEDFYINRFGKKLYSMFFEAYTENLWGVHPRDISPDWGEQRVKGLSIWTAVKNMVASALHIRAKKETSLIDRFHYPKFGPGQLWETAAKRVEEMGGVICKNAAVTRVLCENGRVTAVVKNSGEETVPADFVISSMPVRELVAGMDNVPADAQKCARELPYRDFMTVGVLLRREDLTLKPGKKHAPLLPDNWIYVHDRRVKLGRIQVFNNWSPYMVQDPEHSIWLGLEYFCAEGDALWCSSDAEFADMAMRELADIGFVAAGTVPLKYHAERVRKAYPSYFGAYKDIQCVRDYLDTIPNLICVGRNGQHRYNNMDHSVMTGFMAADYILGKIPDKRAVWEVNTEKVYIEEGERRDDTN